jgi:hypothetical protein
MYNSPLGGDHEFIELFNFANFSVIKTIWFDRHVFIRKQTNKPRHNPCRQTLVDGELTLLILLSINWLQLFQQILI